MIFLPKKIANPSTFNLFIHISANKTDKYRPETCCIIGNFYSQRAEHEKAIIYFQRALQLNKRFLSAW